MTEECPGPGKIPARHSVIVATYNVHRWLNSKGKTAPGHALQVIRELNADILALQEVALLHESDLGDAFPHLRDHPHEEPTQTEVLLAESTGMTVILGPTMLRSTSSYGNCLLTAEQVMAVRHHDLSYPHREPRGVLDVDLMLDGAPLRVMVTHLGLHPGERREQVRQLVRLLNERPRDSTLLMGDFNQWFPWWGALAPLKHWFGSFPNHRTFPAFLPIFPLDRIWVHPARRMLTSRTHRSAATRRASDHLPVTAVLRRNGGQAMPDEGTRGRAKA